MRGSSDIGVSTVAASGEGAKSQQPFHLLFCVAGIAVFTSRNNLAAPRSLSQPVEAASADDTSSY
jgi:hypothetical protein